ncbi:MAG: SufD family Fe-S cluster assembly protein [Patescibacteria group bacterium]|jgi:Fe-S cluster assembly protein SufD
MTLTKSHHPTKLSINAIQSAFKAPILPYAKLPATLRAILDKTSGLSQPNRFATIVPCNTKLTIEFTNKLLASWPTLYFIASPRAHLTIIEHLIYSGKVPAGSSTVILCQKGAQADYFGESINNQSFDLNTLTLVDTHGRASLNWYGRLNHRHVINQTIRHIGWNATGEINTIIDARQTANVSMCLTNDHQKQRGRGAIHWAGLGRDHSDTSVDGKVRIGPKGRGTNSVLFQNALLLSEQSRIKTVPNLEILNHDVKAYHGATVGRLSELERFYLTTRGLSSPQADRLLIKAFVHQVVRHAPNENIKRLFDRYLAT